MMGKEIPVNSQGNGSDFWNFNVFISKIYIKIIFISGLIISALFCFGSAVFTGIQHGFIGFTLALLVMSMIWIIYAILWRITCEMSIIAFKIYDELVKMNKTDG